jgi:uncharacterized membrane protein
MKNILPIALMVLTAFVTATAVVFCLAGGANSTPAQIRTLKLWMAGLSLLGIAGIVTGILLLRAGQHGWASGAAAIPSAIILIIFIVALNRGG